jgi:Cu+-exporting ATPase
LGTQPALTPEWWQETAGAGVEAMIGGKHIKMGSAAFTGLPEAEDASLYVRINNEKTILFRFSAALRPAIPHMLSALQQKGYSLSLLSGDKDRERTLFAPLFPSKGQLLFGRHPIDKLRYVEQLQQNGAQVLMVGDGLNDAGALQQSNVGITLADDVNNFTPSCDAILDARFFHRLPALMQLSQAAGRIIYFCFAISLLYNVAGLYFSMRGLMRPMIAAILMPASTLTIVLITWGLTTWVAYRLKLSLKNNE